MVVRTKARATELKQQPAPAVKLTQASTYYISILEKIEQTYNNPTKRSVVVLCVINYANRMVWRLQGPSVPGSGDFWDSRMATEPFVYAKNMAYWRDGVEFRVGNVVNVSDAAFQFGRIERLVFGDGDWLSVDVPGAHIPPLRVVVSPFVEFKRLPSTARLGRAPHRGEFFLNSLDLVQLVPTQITSVHNMLTVSNSGQAHCRLELVFGEAPARAVSFKPYRPLTVLYTFRAIAENRPFVFLEISIDATSVRNSRARSSTAVYMRLPGNPSQHNTSLDNVYTVMWIPPHVDLYEV